MADYEEQLNSIIGSDTTDNTDDSITENNNVRTVSEPNTFNVDNRTINIPPTITDIVVKGDTNSRTITFKLNRYFDGVDLSNKAIKIDYENSLGQSGSDSVDNIIRNDDTFTFDWTISNGLTIESGKVRVAIDCCEIDSDGNLVYRWQTVPVTFDVLDNIEVMNNVIERTYDIERNFVNGNPNYHTLSEIIDTNAPIEITNRTINIPLYEDVVVSMDNNSQILSFTMDRFVDNIDLCSKTIAIKYVNALGESDRALAVNVSYTSDKITLGWLIDSKVTKQSGFVRFAIEFLGYTENRFYCWQTKPSQIEVSEGLYIDGSIDEPTPSWLQSWQIQADNNLKSMELELRNENDIIQWKHRNDNEWIDLFDTSNIQGGTSDFSQLQNLPWTPLDLSDTTYNQPYMIEMPDNSTPSFAKLITNDGYIQFALSDTVYSVIKGSFLLSDKSPSHAYNHRFSLFTGSDIVNINYELENANKKIYETSLSYLLFDIYSEVAYYIEENYYDKTQVNDLIDAIQSFNVEVVSELPATGAEKTIYLVPNNSTDNNAHDEYIYINGKFELIGSTQVDLSGYATETWVNGQISGFKNETEINNLIDLKDEVYVGANEPTGDEVLWYDTDEIENVAQTVVSQGADFGEVCNWYDGNPNSEDRLYRFVTIVGNGREVSIANSTSQISGTSNLKENVGFLGHYYLDDENDKSKVVMSIIGVVPVKTNDNTIVAGDRVMSDDNGCAVKSSNNLGYRVLEVLEEGLLNIVISPNTDMIQRIKTDMVEKADKIEVNKPFKFVETLPTVGESNASYLKAIKNADLMQYEAVLADLGDRQYSNEFHDANRHQMFIVYKNGTSAILNWSEGTISINANGTLYIPLTSYPVRWYRSDGATGTYSMQSVTIDHIVYSNRDMVQKDTSTVAFAKNAEMADGKLVPLTNPPVYKYELYTYENNEWSLKGECDTEVLLTLGLIDYATKDDVKYFDGENYYNSVQEFGDLVSNCLAEEFERVDNSIATKQDKIFEVIELDPDTHTQENPFMLPFVEVSEKTYAYAFKGTGVVSWYLPPSGNEKSTEYWKLSGGETVYMQRWKEDIIDLAYISGYDVLVAEQTETKYTYHSLWEHTIPQFTAADRNKFLKVNMRKQLEWASVQHLPTITYNADEGKIAQVVNNTWTKVDPVFATQEELATKQDRIYDVIELDPNVHTQSNPYRLPLPDVSDYAETGIEKNHFYICKGTGEVGWKIPTANGGVKNSPNTYYCLDKTLISVYRPISKDFENEETYITFEDGYTHITYIQTPTTCKTQSLRDNTLAPVKSADNGKIMRVVSGAWELSTVRELPVVTTKHDGNILRVVNGKWATVTPNYKENPQSLTLTSSSDLLTLVDNAEYYGTDILTLNLTYPTTNFECYLSFTIASEGVIDINIPHSKYIGTIPTFENGKQYEVSIKNGVVIIVEVSNE